MPFDAGTLAALETVLSDGFEYHRAMDSFIIRAGVPEDCLRAARHRADEVAKNSPRRWPSASKRYVAQELITSLTIFGESGDRYVAGLLTAIQKHDFTAASQAVRDAVEYVRQRIVDDRKEREERERLRREEIARRANDEATAKERAFTARENARDALRMQFFALMDEPNHQKRGYALEAFLNKFLDFECLDPRGSFRLVGEQIDGSFSSKGRTHLTEAKWVKEPVAGAEFGAFIYKIEGKTADTRGLYISVNGYAPTALQGLQQKGALRFVCIDGAHIVRALSPGQTFSVVLDAVWRQADETGEAYMPVSKMCAA